MIDQAAAKMNQTVRLILMVAILQEVAQNMENIPVMVFTEGITKGTVMAEYQTIEYRIGKDGKIVETVLNAAGASCIETTAAIEQALGTVKSQERLPEFYDEESLTADALQLLQQKG